jgi:hypothetical protein
MRKALVVLFACAALAQEKSDVPEEIHEWLQAMAVSQDDLDDDAPRAKEEFEVKLKHAVMAQYKLADTLQQQPELWAKVRRGLQRMLPQGEKRADVRTRLLAILATDKDESSRKIVRAEIDARPEAFPPRTLVELDERGEKGARVALITVVKNGADPYQPLIEPAAHLALRGIDVGKEILERASRDERFTKYTGPNQYCVAIALKRLGDDTFWKKTVEAARVAVGEQMEKSNFKAARWQALHLEYFSRLAASKEPIHVLTVNHEAYKHVRAREKDIDSPVDLHELLTDLAKA